MNRLSSLAPLALLLAAFGVGSCDSKPLGSVDGCTYYGTAHPSGVTFPATDGCNTCSCQNGVAACTLIACVDASIDGGGGNCFDSNGNVIMCTIVDAGAQDARTSDAGATEAGAKDGGAGCFDASGKATSCGTDAGAGTDGGATCFDVNGAAIRCATDAGVECMYASKPYPVGASFPSSDGCNSCTCDAGGMIACTQKACAPDGGPTGVCMPGADQTCNDDSRLNVVLGKCRSDLTCDCGPNMLNPMTGRCATASTTTGCSYGGTTYPVGSKFMCSVDAGCNDGVCVCATPGVAVPLCSGQPVPVCGFDAVYVYGQTGGLVAYSDQVTLTPPNSYVLVRTASANAGATSGACGPALPACLAGPIDVSLLMHDISDPTVQLLLSLSTMEPTLLGIDQRPVDGTVFSFKKSGTAGFLVGAPCNGATGCVDIPGGVRSLMDDLQKLDAQQRQDPSCAAFMKM